MQQPTNYLYYATAETIVVEYWQTTDKTENSRWWYIILFAFSEVDVPFSNHSIFRNALRMIECILKGKWDKMIWWLAATPKIWTNFLLVGHSIMIMPLITNSSKLLEGEGIGRHWEYHSIIITDFRKRRFWKGKIKDFPSRIPRKL